MTVLSLVTGAQVKPRAYTVQWVLLFERQLPYHQRNIVGSLTILLSVYRSPWGDTVTMAVARVAVVLLLTACIFSVTALPKYTDELPNLPVVNGQVVRGVGHIDPKGAGELNPFGKVRSLLDVLDSLTRTGYMY